MRRALTDSRWVAAASVVALAVLPSAASAGGRSGTPQSHLVVEGYPYASSCPAAGFTNRIDRWRMDVCNCTSYAAWALHANGQRIDWFIAGAMDAWNWPHVATLGGLRVGNRPRARAIAVWPRLFRPFGHVAYVTAVDRDGGFDVGEYNFPPATDSRLFLFDRRYDVSARGVVFIYVPRARSTE